MISNTRFLNNMMIIASFVIVAFESSISSSGRISCGQFSSDTSYTSSFVVHGFSIVGKNRFHNSFNVKKTTITKLFHVQATNENVESISQNSIGSTSHFTYSQPQHNKQSTTKSTFASSTSPYASWVGRVVSVVGTIALVSSLTVGSFNGPALAENELSAKYGNQGFDTSLVDQTCLLNHCSIQAKACLQDDSNCRKGLTCTAKCLGDNSCITGCMARYGNSNLDSLLKCTIEDHECIKVAILPGGADEYGTEPLSPVPVVQNFNIASMTGSWYKVMGYNPNYDCYACQRNTFTSSSLSTSTSTTALPQLNMKVEFSMPHLLPDGSPLPPTAGIKESLVFSSNTIQSNDKDDDIVFRTSMQKKPTLSTIETTSTMKSIGLNEYSTQETMVFDQGYYSLPQTTTSNNKKNEILVLNQGTAKEASYRRTAHSEGEMFGLKFWENWYIIGENEPNEAEEFKFVYYNGKTRQNTYSGAFVYSRTKDLSDTSMRKIYQIAKDAGMDPNQFCKIRNGCFADNDDTVIVPASPQPQVQQQQQMQPLQKQPQLQESETSFFRGLLASTRISELLGVEPVAARDTIRRDVPIATILTPPNDQLLLPPILSSMPTIGTTKKIASSYQRPWWNEIGDYLENPHRHFQVMDDLRVPMVWPDDVVVSSKK